ncbi:harbinger transposase-derived nuclease domain-containing protein [Artemisia annua]|uniref:Harbinger transposase-derived nuclease domain-containing protein n=1 Tax=Artemisia annua TaxID=35608 RepID=A0A2U1LY51_ARTAN|nr:harbinger transposase-derived nuclease domain-containing protein [Artemisia annua]
MNRANLPTKDVILHRKNVREEMLHNLSTSGKCRDIIRMSEKAFTTLCNILVNDGDLRPTQRMSVEEQVARFLHVVGNDLRNRFASWIYRRSGSTTNRASGVASQTAKEKNANEKKGQTSNKEPIDIETIEDIDELLASNKVTYENLVNLEEIYVDSPMPDASNSTKSKNKKRKLEEESNSDIMSTVHVVADAIKEGNLVLQETNVILGRAYQREYTGDEIYKELEPLKLEDDVISNAFIFLADNPKKARLLFSCPLNMRADLLNKMMGSSDEMSSI